MSKDKNFERRMIVSKFSNRPPFDLKKPVESYNIEEKIRAYPEEACKSCCKNRSTKINYLKEFSKPSKYLLSPETIKEPQNRTLKEVIPKILENFQKLTPVPTTKTMSNKIPKHKLMKNLLQNFEFEGENYKKAPEKSKKKSKKNKKHFFEEDEVIRPDFNVKFEFKRDIAVKSSDTSYDTPSKLDKRTSTTGLLWPPKSKEMLRYQPNNKSIKERSTRTNQFCSNSFLEEKPTKDVSECSSKLVTSEKLKTKLSHKQIPKMPNKTLQHNDKTFVQAQVDKLNKVLTGPRIPIPPQPPQYSGYLRKEEATRLSQQKYSKGATSGYMELLDRMKNHMPRLENCHNYQSTDSDQCWSDTSESEIPPERITFPKETRMAMDQYFSEKRQKIPLSKFTRVHENVRPAVAPNGGCSENCRFHGDLSTNKEWYRGELREMERRPGQIPSRSRVNTPCKKNLLCDRGEKHQGPCGYTHKNNKVVY